ncbi:ankyrin repeat-containing domain protein, partial [Baffinella frigidus]
GELREAALEGRREQVQHLLLYGGVDVDSVSAGLNTALHCAALEGCADIVEILLDAGASTEMLSMCSQTALHLAAARGNAVVVKMLLDGGADKNARHNLGRTPLMEA